jgi:hypothetical protein
MISLISMAVCVLAAESSANQIDVLGVRYAGPRTVLVAYQHAYRTGRSDSGEAWNRRLVVLRFDGRFSQLVLMQDDPLAAGSGLNLLDFKFAGDVGAVLFNMGGHCWLITAGRTPGGRWRTDPYAIHTGTGDGALGAAAASGTLAVVHNGGENLISVRLRLPDGSVVEEHR